MVNIALKVKSSDSVGAFASGALWSVLELVIGRRQGETCFFGGEVHGVVEREGESVVDDARYDSGVVRWG